jgi:hypothetical protein
VQRSLGEAESKAREMTKEKKPRRREKGRELVKETN